jgi:hypothetical protein
MKFSLSTVSFGGLAASEANAHRRGRVAIRFDRPSWRKNQQKFHEPNAGSLRQRRGFVLSAPRRVGGRAVYRTQLAVPYREASLRKRNLMIAMMVLIVLAAVTVKAFNMATTRPPVTIKIPYRTSTAFAPTTRIVPVPTPAAEPGGTLFAGKGDASAGSSVGPAIAP